MKKIFKVLFVLAVLLSISSVVYAAQTIPAVGIKTWVTSTTKPGCIGYDDYGNCYQYVLNNSSEAQTAYHPAFYDFSSGTNYTVTGYDGLGYGSAESFAGAWKCDSSGSSTIAAAAYGWIQVGGYGYCYVRNTAGAISIGSHLTGAATYKALVITTAGSSVEGVYQGSDAPIALATQNSSTASAILIFFRGGGR